MTYTIRYSDSTKTPISVVNNQVDTTTNINLVGKDYKNYGEAVNQNFLYLLENFASSTAPSKPIEGQLWYDSANNQLKYFDSATSGVWKPVASMSISNSEPSNPQNGHFWLDLRNGNLQYRHNGQWEQIGNSATVSSTAPLNPVAGQLWLNPDTEEVNIRIGDEWKPLGTSAIISSTPPSTADEGTSWLDSGNLDLYVRINGIWVPIASDGGTKIAYRIGTRIRRDNNDAPHETIEILVDDGLVSIFSSDSEWTPHANERINPEDTSSGVLTSRFSTIQPGINLPSGGTNVHKFIGTATMAQYSDLAERYHADAPYEPGTVVEIGGVNEITQTSKAYSKNVFGIVSTAPGLMMNSGAGDDSTHPYIALSGRVPVRVTGMVRKGQRLVSSELPGHAKAHTFVDRDFEWRTIIGRALENKNYSEPGIIEAVVGIK